MTSWVAVLLSTDTFRDIRNFNPEVNNQDKCKKYCILSPLKKNCGMKSKWWWLEKNYRHIKPIWQTWVKTCRLLNGKIACKWEIKSIHLSASEVRCSHCEERLRQDSIRCQNIHLPFRIISARLGWAKTLATRNTMRAFFGLTKSVRRALFRNPTNSLVYMSRFSWMKAALSKRVQDLWV